MGSHAVGSLRMDRISSVTERTVIEKIIASDVRHKMHQANKTYFSMYVR